MAHAVHADGRAAGPPLRRGDRMPPALDQTRGRGPHSAREGQIRKLEHVLAKARAEGANVLLNTGEVQSIRSMQTAASAARLGILRAVPQPRADVPALRGRSEAGNILLCRILGAQVHLVPPGADRGAAMRRRAEELRAEGGIPIIPRGSSTAEGALGSLRCFLSCSIRRKPAASRRTPLPSRWAVPGTTAGFLAGAHALALSGGPDIPLYAFDTFVTDYPVQAVNASWRTPRITGFARPAPEYAGKAAAHSPAISWGPGYSALPRHDRGRTPRRPK